MQQLIKEERKEKEEGRRVVGLTGSPLGLAGRPTVCLFVLFCFFVFLAVGLTAFPRYRRPSPSL
jgi:hypothetical protein